VPAPAVIPAPIVYIKVVAVKKLVVGPRGGTPGVPHQPGGLRALRGGCLEILPEHRPPLVTYGPTCRRG